MHEVVHYLLKLLMMILMMMMVVVMIVAICIFIAFKNRSYLKFTQNKDNCILTFINFKTNFCNCSKQIKIFKVHVVIKKQ